LEQIGHEEEGLKVLRAFEAEGWMKELFPAWTSAKADEAGLTALHDLAVELLSQGVHPDMSAAQMRLLTAKLAGRELATLKKQMLRPGFVEEWSSLDALAAGFAKALLSKHNSSLRPASSSLRAMIQKQFYGLGLPAKMRSSRNALISSSKSGPKPASVFLIS